MTRAIKFTKMHGAGNDYIYVDTTQYPISHPEELARAWSAPHTGIGSDGLVLIGSSDKADFSMRIFNADGSEARMCGNARDRKSTRLNSSHWNKSRMPSSA